MSIVIGSFAILKDVAVLAGSTITSNATTTVTGGSVGLYPGTSITGPITANTILSPANAQTAKTELNTFNNNITAFVAALPSVPLTTYTNETLVLNPDTNYTGTGITFVGTTVEFNGTSNDRFFVTSTSSLSFSGVTFVLNSVLPEKIHMRAQTGSITFTTMLSDIPGIHIADQSISVGTSSTFSGRLFAKTGAVTFDGEMDIVSNGAVVCYAKGTLILTDNGYVPIEKIKTGDQVVTNGKIYEDTYIKGVNTLEPVVWISSFKRKNLNAKSKPICIQKNAFGSTPFQDLYVSPQHRLIRHGKMIKAKKLVNGTTIRQPDREEIVYYHLECEDHCAIVANGVLAESYVEVNNRHIFETNEPRILIK